MPSPSLAKLRAQLANVAVHLGMKVYGYDPFITVDAAWRLSKSVVHAKALGDIYANCDYISIHVPSTPDTKGMINSTSISCMKDGVRIINLARADLVNATDIKKAIADGKVASYVTDFPTEEVIGVPGIVTIPHLGASTPESEDNCAVMAANELIDFLESGNIKNSVNYPEAVIPYSGKARLCIFHKNVPNVVAQVSTLVSESKVNIENMINCSKKDNAYTLIEVNGELPEAVVQKVAALENITRVRVVK